MSEITILNIKAPRLNPEHMCALGHHAKRRATKQGGTARAVFLEGTLSIAFEGVPPGWVQEFSAGLARSTDIAGPGFECTQIDDVPTGVALAGRGVMKNEVLKGKLTLKFIRSLPNEAYLISSALHRETHNPLIAGQVGALCAPLDWWSRIHSMGMAGGPVHVLWSEEAFLRMLLTIRETVNDSAA